jgi:hypothetical protein
LIAHHANRDAVPVEPVIPVQHVALSVIPVEPVIPIEYVALSAIPVEPVIPIEYVAVQVQARWVSLTLRGTRRSSSGWSPGLST